MVTAGDGDSGVGCGTVMTDYSSAAESAAKIADDDLGWFNVKPVLTKVNTNPKTQLSRSNSKSSRSSSQRFSGNPHRTATAAAPIIVLPNTMQHSGSRARCKLRPTNTRIFPKKPHHAGGNGRRKTMVPEDEPSSPKVSCIGKVLSDREREKCRHIRQAMSMEKKKKKKEKKNKEKGAATAGCWGSLAVMFRSSGGGRGKRVAVEEELTDYNPVSSPPTCALSRAAPKRPPPGSEAAKEPPMLGAMKWLASGRRSGSWAGDVEVDVATAEERMGHAALSGPSD